MTDKSAEHLSCLIDDELDARGSRFLIRRLAGDRSLQATWWRYHLMRACLHREAAVAVDLSSRVAAALDTEANLEFAPNPASRWFKPLAGGAIAAAVAVVAVVGVMRQQPQFEPPAATDPITAESGFTSQPSALDRQFTQPAVPVGYSEPRSVAQSDSDRIRINTYVLRHNQVAGGAGNTGFISYVPIVTERPAGAPETAGSEEQVLPATPSGGEADE